MEATCLTGNLVPADGTRLEGFSTGMFLVAERNAATTASLWQWGRSSHGGNIVRLNQKGDAIRVKAATQHSEWSSWLLPNEAAPAICRRDHVRQVSATFALAAFSRWPTILCLVLWMVVLDNNDCLSFLTQNSYLFILSKDHAAQN